MILRELLAVALPMFKHLDIHLIGPDGAPIYNHHSWLLGSAVDSYIFHEDEIEERSWLSELEAGYFLYWARETMSGYDPGTLYVKLSEKKVDMPNIWLFERPRDDR